MKAYNPDDHHPGALFQTHIHSVAKRVRLQPLRWPSLENRGIEALMHRDDELPGDYSGNKYYKLYYNLRNALQQGSQAIVSFGGYYSNHLHALAAAGRDLNIATVGIVRGYEPKRLSATLQDARDWGMELLFLDRKNYRNKDISGLLPILKANYDSFTLIPEGGENLAGIRGCMALGQAIANKMDVIAPGDDYSLCVASGSGASLAGLAAGSLSAKAQCLGISVLKGDDRLSSKIHGWLELVGKARSKWQLITGYHQGGYAKVSPSLLDFMDEFESNNQLQLDPVYTAKLVWAIEDLATRGFWPTGSRLVVMHSGGLQGRRGFDLNR